jgi:hypothetical protein
MSGKIENENVGRFQTVRDRVVFLLRYRWSNNQTKMAGDLGVTQSLVSKIVNGDQRPGSRFIAALARQPGISAKWLLEGGDPPTHFFATGTLPVSRAILPGPPIDYPELVTGERFPVASAFDRPSRYWLSIQTGSPLLQVDSARLLIGDLLLVETVVEWTRNLELLLGRICCVRQFANRTEPCLVMGIVSRDADGEFLAGLDFVARLVTPTPESPSPPVIGASPINRLVKRTRTLREVDVEGRPPSTKPTGPKVPATLGQDNDSGQTLKAEKPTPDEPALAESSHTPVSDKATFTLQDVVGTCVYIARPNPVVSLFA